MVSRCSCPLQMVPLGRRVPSSPRHLLLSPTNCLLSSFFICHHHLSRHSHACIKLPSHWVSLCFNLILFKDKGHSEVEIKRHQFALSSLYWFQNPEAFLSCVCVYYCALEFTPLWDTAVDQIRCDSGGKGKQSGLTVCQVWNKSRYLFSPVKHPRARPKHGLHSAEIYSHSGLKLLSLERLPVLGFGILSSVPVCTVCIMDWVILWGKSGVAEIGVI